MTSPEQQQGNVVAITLKQSWGQTRAYPSNRLAELLCEFAQTATLTKRHLRLLEEMGFTLENHGAALKLEDVQ